MGEEIVVFDRTARPSCPECGSDLVFDTSCGEYICQSCGYVVMDKMDYCGHETHSNNSHDRQKSIRGSGHTSFLLVNRGLQTEIGTSNKDYTGRPISCAAAERIANVRRLHARLKASSEERRIARVLSAIEKICSKMLLPRSLSEAAAKIYRNYSTRNDTRGLSVTGNAAAAVYLACKQSCIARGLEEITRSADFSSGKGSSLKIAFRCYKKMVMCMTDANEADEAAAHPVGAFDHVIPRDRYIAKVANMAGIDWRVQRVAVDIAQQTEGNILLSGKDPVGIAAAYLYISACICGYNMYLTDIANFSRVTEITIRTRCKEILSSFNLEIRVKKVDRAALTSSCSA
jgi:transcription initiation factor TFIIB